MTKGLVQHVTVEESTSKQWVNNLRPYLSCNIYAYLVFNVYFTCFSVPSWVAAVRAMSILGFLFIGGAGCCAFLKLFVMENQASFAKLAGICALASGEPIKLLMIIYKASLFIPPSLSLSVSLSLSLFHYLGWSDDKMMM